jgi:hydroxyacylglutathione hydrolase
MGGPDWKYGSLPENASLLRDGSTFNVGTVRIDVLHTPGHTPEHLTFLITDTPTADTPVGAITGDFIFVGDVGRPDLLEKAAGVAGTKEVAARQLFHSIQKFKSNPDYLQLWPGHGAGSACGKALGAMPSSTLGYERLFNWGLSEENEDAFVRHVLSGQPDPPAYFAVMKRINRDGPPAKPEVPPPDIHLPELALRFKQGALVVDTRSSAEFAKRHAASSINIPYAKSFPTYAGTVLPYDRDVYLIVAEGNADAVIDDLSLIGIDRVGGVYSMRSIDELATVGIALQSTGQISSETLSDRMSQNGQVVLDVRGSDEWEHGHIPGAIHIPLGSLESRVNELPQNGEIAVHCQGGTRSSIGASILQKHGIGAVNLTGGFAEWERSGKPVEKSEEPQH